MTSRTHISRAFVVASVVVSAVVVGGCGSTVGETGESAKSFGKAVGLVLRRLG
jgi:predicted small secreted protein